MRNYRIFLLFFMQCFNLAWGQTVTETPLYPGPIPGSKPSPITEKNNIRQWRRTNFFSGNTYYYQIQPSET